MALFQRISKSGSMLTGRGAVQKIELFNAPKSENYGQGLSIKMLDKDDGKTYSMTLYGEEIETVKKTLSISPKYLEYLELIVAHFETISNTQERIFTPWEVATWQGAEDILKEVKSNL